MAVGENRLKVLSAVRTAYGGLLIAAPGRIITLAGGQPDPAVRWVVRALGARHLVQALLQRRWGTRSTTAGAVVDGLHSASMLMAALAYPMRARLALRDAVGAATFAAAGLAIQRAPRRAAADR